MQHAKWRAREDERDQVEREHADAVGDGGGRSSYASLMRDPRMGRPPSAAELAKLPSVNGDAVAG